MQRSQLYRKEQEYVRQKAKFWEKKKKEKAAEQAEVYNIHTEQGQPKGEKDATNEVHVEDIAHEEKVEETKGE